MCLELFTDAADCNPYVFFLSVSQDQQKFFAPDAGAKVGFSGVDSKDFSKLLEDNVTGGVSVGIIHAFKAVQIGHYDPEGKAVSGGPIQLPCRPCLKRAAIGQTSQGIGKGQRFQLPVFGLNLTMEIYKPAADSHAGQ